MKDREKLTFKMVYTNAELFFLTFAGSGLLPKAPGTWGTFFTLPILFALSFFKAPFVLYIPFVVIMTIISSFIAEKVEKEMKVHDPSWIVIDEFIGMFVTWLFFIRPEIISGRYIALHLFVQFLLFRFFDIIKIWPANYFDQKVNNGFGTIVDDVVSGLYAGILYKAIFSFGIFFQH